MNKVKKISIKRVLKKKKHIRFEKVRHSHLRNRNCVSKRLNRRKKRIERKKRVSNSLRKIRSRKIRKQKKLNMSGGGIPFGGTIKGLLGLTHNEETSRDNMLGNICALNNVRPTTDTHLAGLLTQVCNLNENVKKENKDKGVVKGAMRFIGNVATLPLRTGINVVKNVTGFDAKEAAYNAIKNTVSSEESKKKEFHLLPQQALSGGQPMPIKHDNNNVPIAETVAQPMHMQGGNQKRIQTNPPIHDITALQNIQNKLASGGSLTNEEIQYISKL